MLNNFWGFFEIWDGVKLISAQKRADNISVPFSTSNWYNNNLIVTPNSIQESLSFKNGDYHDAFTPIPVFFSRDKLGYLII